MKSTFKDKEEVFNITPNLEENTPDPISEKNYLFNLLDKFATDHDVSVSNTMIKVTYKKSQKNHYYCDNNLNCIQISRQPENKVKSAPVLYSIDQKNLFQNRHNKSFCISNLSSGFNKVKFSCHCKRKNKNLVCHSELKKKTVKNNKKFVNRINSRINFSQLVKLLKNNYLFKGLKLAIKSHQNLLKGKFKTNKKFFKNSRVLSKKISLFTEICSMNSNKNHISENRKVKRTSQEVSDSASNYKVGKNFGNTAKRKINTQDVFKKKLKREEGNSTNVRNLSNYTKNSKSKSVYKDTITANKIDDNMNNKKAILFVDPELPSGWTRFIRTRDKGSPDEKHFVYVVSPQGKKFRYKWKLRRYLEKINSNLDPDQFFFGLYQRTKSTVPKAASEIKMDTKDAFVINEKQKFTNKKKYTPQNKALGLSNVTPGSGLINFNDIKTELESSNFEQAESMTDTDDDEDDGHTYKVDLSNNEENDRPMYDDPNLPEGWRRFIKIRGCGESAGRMEVIIVSPDGRRHRSKGQLDHYLKQNNLEFKAEDFDFSVFGKFKKRPNIIESKELLSCLRRKFKSILNDNPVPDLDINSLKEIKYSLEGKAINTVNGLMISSGISSPRNERRSRIPRKEHEKKIKSHLESEDNISSGNGDIPNYWIQRLVKCRSEIRPLESEAVTLIASRTKEFLQELCRQAFKNSSDPEHCLLYKDVAAIVEKSECLSPLKNLIPPKITFRQFIKLNRPKQFLSFT